MSDSDYDYTQNRELAWLRFNQRVIDEAQDPQVPLFERLKFAAIFTSNLDEFFMIRVGSITDMSLVKASHIDDKSGWTPTQQLDSIFSAVTPLYHQRETRITNLEWELRKKNIYNLKPSELTEKELEQCEGYYREAVLPILSPQVVDPHHPFPHLPNKALTLALELQREGESYLGIVPIPKSLPPFLLLEGDGLRYILMEQLMLSHVGSIFASYHVTHSVVIGVTRNADISPEDEDIHINDDYRQHMRKLLKKRSRLAPVRLEIQGIPEESFEQKLLDRLQLKPHQRFYTKAPIAMNYVFALESKLSPTQKADLCYPPFRPKFPKNLHPKEGMIPQILRKDILLFYPYHTMAPFLTLMREASCDPCVVSIKITIYRLASQAKLVEYLVDAAENGKDVTVLMELRARFDEQNNIVWAERLEEAGCTLLYGFDGMKVHSKICLITRQERGKIQYITQVGTGNYNEKTARMYTDFSFLTAHPAIGADSAAFFQNMATSNLKGVYTHLLVAPHSLLSRINELIDEEIQRAKEGKDARIFIKCNAITDRSLIDKLAYASQAGVDVILNVRGTCCLLPQVAGKTERIRIFSVVGRYLEHPRILVFGVGENRKIYIGSCDLMTRNTHLRVEIACPIRDVGIQDQILHVIDVLCHDNVKARQMDSNGEYHPISSQGTRSINAQEIFMEEATHQEEMLPTSLRKWDVWKNFVRHSLDVLIKKEERDL